MFSLKSECKFYKPIYNINNFIRFLFVRERERAQADRVAEGEAGSLRSKEPDVGLNPRTLGS